MLPLHAHTLISSRCASCAPARCPVLAARLVATAAAAGDGWRAEQPEASSSSSAAAWGSSWSSQAKNRRKRPKQSSDPGSQQTPSQEDRDLDAAIRANVDRAASMLDEIMQEVGQEVFMSEATAYLYDGPPDVTLQQAVHDAISRRMEWLDGNFLAAINAYVVATEQQGNPQLQRVLATIRSEVLQQVAGRLPAAVQVLNAALAYPRRSHRLAVLLTSIAGGGRPVLTDPAPSSSSSSSTGSSQQGGGGVDDSTAASTSAATTGTTDSSSSSSSDNVRHGPAVPGATLEALAGSAMQLVDDMEDQEIIADRVLLARLVLLREELRAQAEKRRSASMMGSSSSSSSTSQSGSKDADGGFFTYQRTNLPRRCAAFLKELLAVADRGRRLALMRKSFGEDWDFAGEPEQRRMANEAPDVLRPGRFLSTLYSTKHELQQAYVEGKLAGQGHADGGARLLERLDDIELEALVVLDAMQAEGGDKGMPGSVQSSSESSIDEATDYKLPSGPATA